MKRLALNHIDNVTRIGMSKETYIKDVSLLSMEWVKSVGM